METKELEKGNELDANHVEYTEDDIKRLTHMLEGEEDSMKRIENLAK